MGMYGLWLMEIGQDRIRRFVRDGSPVSEEWVLDSQGRLDLQ